METVLVTGGAGFIGSHLCQRLLEDSKVICVDNLSSGTQENIKTLLKYKDFTFMDRDVRDAWKIKGKVDQIYSLASRASPVDFTTHALDIMTSNALGTINMLNLAKENNAKFLLTSTSEVYGDPKEHPQKESYHGYVNTVGPRSCYDESKRFAEAYTYTFSQQNNIDYRIARLFNTYGPRMRPDDGRITPNFIMQALKGQPLTVYGDGSQTRSFTYVEDTVEGIWRLMNYPQASRQVINIGNPEETTVLEFAKKVKEITGSYADIEFKDLPKDDPVKRKPDITKAQELLGWRPRITLDEGLKRAVEWFKQLQ